MEQNLEFWPVYPSDILAGENCAGKAGFYCPAVVFPRSTRGLLWMQPPVNRASNNLAAFSIVFLQALFYLPAGEVIGK